METPEEKTHESQLTADASEKMQATEQLNQEMFPDHGGKSLYQLFKEAPKLNDRVGHVFVTRYCSPSKGTQSSKE